MAQILHGKSWKLGIKSLINQALLGALKNAVFKKLMPSRVMSFEETFLYVECCGKL